MLIGVVGKPSCGKSTFFKAATLADVEIANYPFTTIKPNHAVGFVKIKDPAIDFNKHSNPRMGYVQKDFRFVPIDLIDVAGLVPGAHEGAGMGSQFLNDLNQADALIHVIDISGSTNEKGESVQALSYNPSNDIKFLELELNMWYLEILKKGWEKFARGVHQEHKDISKALAKQLSGLKVTEEIVKPLIANLSKDPTSWSEKNLLGLASELRKQTKPMIIAANKIDVPGAEENFKRLKKEFPNLIIIPCSSESELALKEAHVHELIEYLPGENNFKIKKEISEKQKAGLEFIQENVLKKFESTGVQTILNKIVFEILDQICLFPGGVKKLEDSKGNVIPDCFLMPNGTTALGFAFRLHTDFGNKFAKAINVRTKLAIGKEYKLKNMDIIEIMTS
ncbi:MAG: redox-regulated ATPase YchF [Nanoarchaeota archaeon]|nr:redox-regulated ATPase YchF [Nanoarchaeota archaeon]MBU1444992.1 redox-regulated ATPase YchF [Nanoarchaeota archaeon]MBU2420848.1 redox-regulated ATPase YchF [Nanoarchaeota archaeon]MBU2475824.1 redox-regulated ATPase YchF [Nanoarchaeota archaeon]